MNRFMKFLRYPVLAVLALLGMASIAGATPIISLFGDIDGFGLGSKDGETFDLGLLPWFNNNPPDVLFTTPGPYKSPGVPYGTDAWVPESQTWTHSYTTPDSSYTSAYIEIFAGALGKTGSPAELYMDGNYIGDLAIGHTNYARYDRFYLDLSDLGPTSTDFEIRTTLDDEEDWWVMDHSRLIINTPEPGTLILLGSGLAGLAGYGRFAARRKQKKSKKS